MSKVGLSNAIPAQPLSLTQPAPGRPATQAAKAAPAGDTRLAPSDRLQTTAGAAPKALTSIPLVDSGELKTLRPLLAQSSLLINRSQDLSDGLPPAEREALDNLQALLMQGDAIEDTLGTLSEDPNLDPAFRDYLNQMMHQLNAVLASAQAGDKAAFQQALSAPIQAGNHSLPLGYGIRHLQHTLEFDQVLQRRSARELLIPNMNQAYKHGLSLLDSGTSLARVAEQVVQDTQKAMGEQNKTLLASLASGDVQKSIFGLQRRFVSHLKEVPGFVGALQKAMTEAGMPADKISQLVSSDVIGKMPIEELEKLQTSLRRQLAAVPDDRGHAALRSALSATIDQDFKQIISLRSGFQQFRVTMQEHVSELTGDLLRFAKSSGFELPQDIRRALEDNPLDGCEKLKAWIDQRRAASAGKPEALHTLDGLEQFALQLGTGAGILNRVEGGQQIDTGLMDNFEKFQTFILAKRALIDYFDNKGSKPLRDAILTFGNKYADWQKLSAADRQQELMKFLGGYLDHSALVTLEKRINSLRAGFEAHNQRVDQARAAGVELVKPENCPHQANLDRQIAGFDARLAGLSRRESAYYRHVYETRGDAGLREQLRQDRAQILDPLAHSMEQLEKGLPESPQSPAQTAIAAEAPPPSEAPMPSAESIDQHLRQAEIDQRLDAAVNAIKSDLLRSLRDNRQQFDAQRAARRLQDQLQHQIFEIHNQRQLEANRHRLAALENIDEFIKHQLARADASARQSD